MSFSMDVSFVVWNSCYYSKIICLNDDPFRKFTEMDEADPGSLNGYLSAFARNAQQVIHERDPGKMENRCEF
jgi:hypothetical protein